MEKTTKFSIIDDKPTPAMSLFDKADDGDMILIDNVGKVVKQMPKVPDSEFTEINKTKIDRRFIKDNKSSPKPEFLDEELLKQDAKPSSEILGHDPISDPNVKTEIFETKSVMSEATAEVKEPVIELPKTEEVKPVISNTIITPQIKKETIKVANMNITTPSTTGELDPNVVIPSTTGDISPNVVIPSTTVPIQEVPIKKQEVVINKPYSVPMPEQIKTETVEKKIEDPRVVQRQQQILDNNLKDLNNTKKTIEKNKEHKTVMPTPINLEDESIDLDINTIGKEEIKAIETNLEDVFEPFDGKTSTTITTDKERTEIIIPNMEDNVLLGFIDKMNAISESNDREAISNIANKLQDQHTYESRVARASLFKSDKQQFEQTALDKALEEQHQVVNSVELDGTTYKDKMSAKSQLNKIDNGSIISSKDSFPLAMALLGGIRKVHFYNSGFWVIVRPPLISELHTYYTRCQQQSVEYGHIFGQLSYFPADIDISRAGIDLFKSCIVNSNLENWNADDNLEKALAASDEQTCLWALASLMFPEGTEIEYVCSHDDCHYIDRVTIDVSKLRYFDYSRLGAEALKYCHSSEKRTLEDINNYKENIFKNSNTYNLNNEWIVKITEPSLYNVLQAKNTFVDDMANVLELNDYDKIDDYLSARAFRILSPWVSQISYINPNDGKRVFFNFDTDSITDALQLRFTNLPELITKHVQASKVSYFCYAYSGCPKCGNQPPSDHKGLIPCDMQQSFFSHSTELLK